ncbi:MAG: Fpg/Nei family DNA glycosylase [Candidatus Eiseniibacteriota bacterium]|nr:MAG: Fpg/Nei family DNA glycosylase [Candidatus Eisenbacteria bacterium]
MPELPEILSRAREMKMELIGKTISGVEVMQPKCLNVRKKTFVDALTDAKVLGVTSRGKWIFVETSKGWLLLNLGMGGEILLVSRKMLPEKRRLVFDFKDGTCLSLNFWWFGYAHYVRPDKLKTHAMTAKLGPNANELGLEDLRTMLKGRRGNIKSFLLNQSYASGIGNAYIHDILFLARLHPLRAINTLSEKEVKGLAKAIRGGLQPSINKGGAFYEVDLYGRKGGFQMKHIKIGYREGKPCPTCGRPIEKIKTGSNSTFICPGCQPRK